MPLKTPQFWYKRRAGWQAALLRPVSWLYGGARAVHCALQVPQRLEGGRVICVGNLNAGGSGKTPSVMALMDVIKQAKIADNPAFLLRGFGGAVPGPCRVDPAVHSAEQVGEEALLLSAYAPVYVARDRYAGAQLAAGAGADVIVMDDGMQNRQLGADLYLAVIDGGMGFGNGALLPAGPLREPLSEGLSRADGFIVIGPDQADTVKHLPAGKPVFRARVQTPPAAVPDKNMPYFAFAGLGYPQKFFEYLRAGLGLNIVGQQAFPDHYAYMPSDVQALRARAAKHGAQLITTQKDERRLVGVHGVDAAAIHIVPIILTFEDDQAVEAYLRERLVAR